MDPSSLQELARSQEPVFWVAAAAIALGVTLLVAALTQFLRRRLGARPAPATPPVTAPDPIAAADIYVPTQRLVAPEFAAPEPPDQARGGDHSLALLLRRLQSAGDRLEEVAGDLGFDESSRDEFGLKEPLRDVEYVFRASGP